MTGRPNRAVRRIHRPRGSRWSRLALPVAVPGNGQFVPPTHWAPPHPGTRHPDPGAAASPQPAPQAVPPPAAAAGGAGAGSPPGDPAGPSQVPQPQGGAAITVADPPKLVRPRTGSVIGGVCAGLAQHLGVPVGWVRATFALLAVIGGAGVVGYALLWIFSPMAAESESAPPTQATARERRQAIGIAAVGLALVILAGAWGLGSAVGWALGPLGLAAVGAAFIWREADDARRARWRRTAAGIVSPARGSLWRLVGGCVLVIGGLSVFALGQLDFGAVRSALVAVVLTLVGVAVITVPWWVRLVRDLGAERAARSAERERAEIAAHLHDSVLQTLALIQRQSGDSREVLRLARGQERELRIWLYGPAGYANPNGKTSETTTFAAALARAAGDVEDTYAVAVAPVVVGDAPMDPHLAALVAAAREAMVNAAKHAGVGEISVYAEIEDGTAAVFVRDRGAGFDQHSVGSDRRGLAESIRGRMERHGGKAVVRSTQGEGTEVELTMPVSTEAATADPGAA